MHTCKHTCAYTTMCRYVSVFSPCAVKRRRNWHRHDYSEINDGNKASVCIHVVVVFILLEGGRAEEEGLGG